VTTISPDRMVIVALSDATPNGLTQDELRLLPWFSERHTHALHRVVQDGRVVVRNGKLFTAIDADRIDRAEAEAKKPKQRKLFT